MFSGVEVSNPYLGYVFVHMCGCMYMGARKGHTLCLAVGTENADEKRKK